MNTTNCDGIRRRDFVRVGVAGGAGLALGLNPTTFADEAPQPNATADACLFINLEGGPSHLDTLDMKPDGPEDTRGPFKPIDSKLPGLQVCEHLPKFATVADRFALMRGIRHTVGDHPQGQSYISTGNRPVPSLIYPSYGSVVAKELTGYPDLPSYVAVPKTEWNAGYMGDGYAPFKTNAVPRPGQPFHVRGLSLADGLTFDKVNRRQDLLRKVDRRFREIEDDSRLLSDLQTLGDRAHSIITSERSRAAFDIEQEAESIRNLFADDELNQGLLLAVRLLEFGVRFVTVSSPGWDTHLDNFNGHKRLLGPLDHGLQAVIAAMDAKGLLERTLVVCMGEFGRTPKINENTGRDHYPRVNCGLFAGGGVKTGQIIGGTNEGGTAPNDATNISPDDVAASIYSALGIDFLKEYHTNTGRPVSIVPHGNVIEPLFG